MSTNNNNNNELLLITGCSGFIAAWICKQALEAGFRVRGTVRDPNNEKKTKFLRELPGASERLELVALDLVQSDEDTFAKVVAGVTLIAHTASPFPDKDPRDENELITPAVQGTVGILKAALNSPTVRRIVVTSSVAAIGSAEKDPSIKRTEKDWTDVTKVAAYSKSKTLAEKAAWDLWREHKPKWSLCTINPAFVIGPSIGPERTTSAEVGIRLLSTQSPAVPRIAFSLVDVRDVAKAHLRALTLPEETVAGHRFILCSDSKWMLELCNLISETFRPMGYSLPKFEAPYFLMWLLSWFDAQVRVLLPRIGTITRYDNTASKELLKIEYTDLHKSCADYGHSLIYHGFIKKTSGYLPPYPDWTPATSDK